MFLNNFSQQKMNSRREVNTADGVAPLLPFSNFPPRTVAQKTSPAKKETSGREDEEQIAVYGIKLWGWKFSIQFPRRYSKVAKSEEECDEIRNRSSASTSASLTANEEFFRHIEFPTGSILFALLNRPASDNVS